MGSNDNLSSFLEEYEKHLMPMDMSDLSNMIHKFGKDINNDYTFVMLAAAFMFKFEDNWIEGKYDVELQPIADEIHKLERHYGLKDDEYFPIGSAPQDIKELNKKYDLILDNKLIELFKEYGLNDFADLYQQNPDEFNKRVFAIRERMSKSGNKLYQIILDLEEEASKCFDISAYNASSALLSAAIEGVIYEACSNSKNFQEVLYEYNKKMSKGKHKKIYSLTFGQLIKFAKSANMYPFDQNAELADKLLNIANHLRNLIHPGRRLSSKVHKLDREDCDFLHALYLNLKRHYIKEK